jgi:hypothetical protein
VLAAGKHTIVFDFQPDEAGFGKGSTGVLKRNVALAEIRFNQIYDVERGQRAPYQPGTSPRQWHPFRIAPSP